MNLRKNRWIYKEVKMRNEVVEIDTSKLTRVEIVDDTGRAYVKWNIKSVIIAIQDAERTMKIFIE